MALLGWVFAKNYRSTEHQNGPLDPTHPKFKILVLLPEDNTAELSMLMTAVRTLSPKAAVEGRMISKTKHFNDDAMIILVRLPILLKLGTAKVLRKDSDWR